MKNFLKKLLGSNNKSTSSIKKKSNIKHVNKTEEELILEIDELQINGFHLPKALINRIKNNKWKEPKNKIYLEKISVENSPYKCEEEFFKNMINDFSLFSIGLMKRESEHLKKWLHPKWEKDYVWIFGKKDDNIYPGFIEHDKVILFADFGHGSDTCFALDFRENVKSPIVILEYWGENPRKDKRWKKIANSFEEFEQIVWKEN